MCARVQIPVTPWLAVPLHEVTTVIATPLPCASLITGTGSGQLCLWKVAPSASDDKPLPRAMLLGHTCPVVSIACCLFERLDAIFSLCRSGQLNVWSPVDGRCLSSAPVPILSGAATVGVVMPQLMHAVIGGECQRLCVVQLSTMVVRCVFPTVSTQPSFFQASSVTYPRPIRALPYPPLSSRIRPCPPLSVVSA